MTILRYRSVAAWGARTAVLAIAAFGCSAASDGASFPPGTGASPGSNGAAGSPGSGQSGTPNPGGGTGFMVPSGGSVASGAEDAGTCFATTNRGETVPLDMFVMWDRSGSMSDQVAGGEKWNLIVDAFDAFVNDPASAGISVGLSYFPILTGNTGSTSGGRNGGRSNVSCTVSDYAAPIVPIAPLPGNASAIAASLQNTQPTGETPTLPALEGALQEAQAYATQHPGHKVIVVLQTDGQPNVCNSTIQAVSAAAAAGVSGTPSIPTYVIGVGTSLSNLDAIAQAGGSGSAIIVDTSQNTTQELLAALTQIRGSAGLPCDFVLSGADIDYTKVNVKFTPSGGSPQNILEASSSAECNPTTGGWYYDNPAQPTRVTLCDASCKQVVADPHGEIDLLFGCNSLPISIN